MNITEYNINSGFKLNIAVVADLHDKAYDSIADAFAVKKPDIIAIPGDLIDGRFAKAGHGLEFLAYASKIAPTFYSLGNHERGLDTITSQKVQKAGAILLDNRALRIDELIENRKPSDGIVIGGLSSGFGKGRTQGNFKTTPPPDLQWLSRFEKMNGYKILLCHHPEYYEKYIRPLKIDLVLAGHAHGGQIRLFGRGLFAPGQGFFPKYTSGAHGNRLIISRGLSNTVNCIPRLFNNKELIFVNLY